MERPNLVLMNDINSFTIDTQLVETLKNSTIIVTGATGLVGSMFVKCVNALNVGIKFILPVRNVAKAKRKLCDEAKNVSIVESDIVDFFLNSDLSCDYVVHCVSPTNGLYISTHPVETFQLAVDSTQAILNFCKNTEVKGVVYLSSIEYYGQIFNDSPVLEDSIGFIDHGSTRNSYAIGKQAAEFLAFSYAKEYNVPVKIARLTQTFGAGISPDDNRVFAQFARNIIKKEDIMLHTKGQSAKPYCYITDCISALIYILIKGKSGEAYNVSTPGTYVSILELAELFSKFGNNTKILIQEGDHGYAPETRVNLNSDKLQALGWNPRYGLDEMISKLISFLKSCKLVSENN